MEASLTLTSLMGSSGLTYEKAQEMLNAKKTNSYKHCSVSWNQTFNIALKIAAFVAPANGWIAFANYSSSYGEINHLNDTYYNGTYRGWPKGTFRVHNNDIWEPAWQQGLCLGTGVMAISLLSVPAVFVAMKACTLGFNFFNKKLNSQKNLQIDRLIALMQLHSQGNFKQSASPKMMPDLLPYFSDSDYASLNFSQIYAIKRYDNHKFEKLLSEKLFPQKFQECWIQLEKLVSLEETLLIQALNSRFHQNSFQSEPALLEALIHQLNEDMILKDSIILLLIPLLQRNASEFSTKNLQWSEIILLMNQEKISLNDAIQICLRQRKFPEDIKIYCNGGSLLASTHLLCENSDVFKAMLQGAFKEGNCQQGFREINLPETKLETLEAFLTFLTAGSLPASHENSECLRDLAIFAHCYNIPSLAQEVERELFELINELSREEIGLILEDFQNYPMIDNFKIYIDDFLASFSYNQKYLPHFLSKQFEEEAKFCLSYKLKKCCRLLLNHFNEGLNELSKNPSKEEINSLIISVTNLASLSTDLLAEIWIHLRPLFVKKPKILKQLWEYSERSFSSEIHNWIYNFCLEDRNYEICLTCWGLPPDKLFKKNTCDEVIEI